GGSNLLHLGVTALGKPVEYAAYEDLGYRCAAGDADDFDVFQPRLVDLVGLVDEVGRARAAFQCNLDEPYRVGGVGRADHDHQIGVAAHELDRALPVLGGIADVVARRIKQLWEPLAELANRG